MAKRKKPQTFSTEELKELTYIRKLLILSLIRDGANSEDIGTALGVDSATVRKMLPFKKLRKREK